MHFPFLLLALFAGDSLAASIGINPDYISTLDRRDAGGVPKCTAKSPPPVAKTCGIHGKFVPGKLNNKEYFTFTNYQTLPTFDACRDLAAPTFRLYNAFGYNSTSGLCTLLTYEIGQHGGTVVPSPVSDSVFYDSACFTCGTYKCPLKRGINLIQDPGFELSSQYIGPWVAYDYKNDQGAGLPNQTPFPKAISVVSPGSDSKNALRINKSKDYHLNIVGQQLDPCKNELYILKFNYKIGSSPGDSNTRIAISCPGGASTTLLSPASTNGTWIAFEDFCNQEPTKIIPELIIRTDARDGGSTPQLNFDNFVYSAVAPLPVKPQPGSKSLLINGGFESGELAPWKYKDISYAPSKKKEYYTIVSPGLGNTAKAFHFTAKRTYIGEFQLSQPIKLKVGGHYIWSVDVAGTTAGPNITIGSRNWLYDSGSGFQHVNRTYSAAFIARRENEMFLMQVVDYSPKKNGNITIDNASVKLLQDL